MIMYKQIVIFYFLSVTATFTLGNINTTSNADDSVYSLNHVRAELPNIIIVLVDDLGYGDLSVSGHPTSYTPVIDRLASQSKLFTQFYVTSPVCSPSRASLLTGRYQARSGVYPGTFVPENPLGMDRNETSIAAHLKIKGYKTLITGKWHLGVGVDGEYLPANFGFDDYLGVPYSHDMCPCLVCYPGDKECHDTCWANRVSCPLYSNTTIIEQPVDLPSLTQRLVDKANVFIEESAVEGKPFFLFLPFMHVHHPQFASAVHEGTTVRGMFGDSLAELDDSVKQILQQLEVLGIGNDTLIWFTSDNGPSLQRHERGGSAGVLRCGKGTTMEGGVRVPAFVTWPGIIQPERSPVLVSSLDIFPTLSSITGASVESLVLDGLDVSSLLFQNDAASPREFFAVYSEAADRQTDPFAVVWGRYKAHFYTIGSDISDSDNYDPMCPKSHPLTQHDPPLLYDLYTDPGERWNIANNSESGSIIATITAWREVHRMEMVWQEPFTQTLDWRAQPCCTNRNCEPFPQCCDCPHENSIWWENDFHWGFLGDKHN